VFVVACERERGLSGLTLFSLHFEVGFVVVATASVAVLVAVTGAVTGAVTEVYTCIIPGGVDALCSYISCS
jgi:hypothetical protein